MWLDDDLYHRVLDSLPIACVDAVIVRNGTALLLKRRDPPAQDQWWLPGGRVYKGETLRQAVHRKALMEAGLDCYVGPVVHTDETIFPDGPFGTQVHSINVCFLLWPKTDGEVELSDEHCDCKWVDETVERCLHPYVIKCLEGAGLL